MLATSSAIIARNPVQVGRKRAATSIIAASGRGFGTDKPQVDNTPKKVSRLGQPTKEDLARQQQAIEAAYGAQQQDDEPDDEVLPSAITDRMLRRVITFAGLPVFVGMMLFPVFWYLKVVQKVDLPMGLVFGVQSLTLALGLAGITYGATSASWDPSREGSALGWNEFRANLAAIMGKVK